MSLDSGRRGQWIETLFLEEIRAFFIESVVVTVDVAHVTGGANNVLPGCAFRFQQSGDVVISAAKLRAEIPRVNRFAGLVNAGRAGDQENSQTVQVNPQPAGERTLVIVRLVEDVERGNRTLLHGSGSKGI